MTVHTPHRHVVEVTGMTCQHCVNAVIEELGALSGVRSVDVILSSGVVTVDSDRELSSVEIAGAVEEAGYTVAG